MKKFILFLFALTTALVFTGCQNMSQIQETKPKTVIPYEVWADAVQEAPDAK
ncbi:MAG: hypothetical protein IJY46_02725 [Lentisphaeria bacterium]|nr:hypothetical protein [Lentisphaeria bacterium]